MRRDLQALVLVLALVLALWAFVELADEVVEGEIEQLDTLVLRALRTPEDAADPRGPMWLEEVVRDLTALGSLAVLLLATLGVAGYLWLRGQLQAMAFVAAATLGGALISTLLKELFARDRPEIVPHLVRVSSASFPSGHAMLAAVVYLTLGALLARLIADTATRLYFVGLGCEPTGSGTELAMTDAGE